MANTSPQSLILAVLKQTRSVKSFVTILVNCSGFSPFNSGRLGPFNIDVYIADHLEDVTEFRRTQFEDKS
jgi:hypothetical protein